MTARRMVLAFAGLALLVLWSWGFGGPLLAILFGAAYIAAQRYSARH